MVKPLIGILVILLLSTQAVSQELNSTLYSTLYGIKVAYVDEMVVFTCVVRGSNNMAWTSDEYIGTPNRQLAFVSIQPEGSEERAIGNNQTVAVLVTAIDTGDIMIVSQLRIRVKPTYPVASVQCISRVTDTIAVNSTSFRLADAASVTCDRQFLCPGETTITCVCATGNSNALAWTINGTRLKFTSNNASLTRYDIPGSSGFVVLTENSIVNGIRVIMSNITVSFFSNDVVLTCGNVDQNVTEPIIVPTIENCPVNPSDTTPAATDNIGDCAGSIAAAVVVSVIIMTVIAILIGIIIFIFHQAKLKEKVEEIKSLTEKMNQNSQDKEREIATFKEKNADTEKELARLRTEVIQKKTVIGDLEHQRDQSKQELQNVKTQADNEKVAALEGFQNIMKEEQKEALHVMEGNLIKVQKALSQALKKTMKEEIDKALSQETSVDTAEVADDALKSMKQALRNLEAKMKNEIDEASSNLGCRIKMEINTILEDKKEAPQTGLTRFVPKISVSWRS